MTKDCSSVLRQSVSCSLDGSMLKAFPLFVSLSNAIVTTAKASSRQCDLKQELLRYYKLNKIHTFQLEGQSPPWHYETLPNTRQYAMLADDARSAHTCARTQCSSTPRASTAWPAWPPALSATREGSQVAHGREWPCHTPARAVHARVGSQWRSPHAPILSQAGCSRRLFASRSWSRRRSTRANADLFAK